MNSLIQFYQQLIRQPALIKIFQDAIIQSQQQGSAADFTIFAPSNDAMARLLTRNEDPEILWRYHIVPGRYDDVTIYNMAQEKFTQANPRMMANVRPQNNLPTLAAPFQVGMNMKFNGISFLLYVVILWIGVFRGLRSVYQCQF